MDFWEWLDLLWSPLWFFWDLCGTVGIILLIRRWIKASVTDTKDSVIVELKNPATGGAVREAMDIVSAAEVNALRGSVDDVQEALRVEIAKVQEEIRAKDIAYQTGLDSRISALKTDIDKAISDGHKSTEASVGRILGDVQRTVGEIRNDIPKVDLSPEKIQSAVEQAAVNQMKSERSKMSREARQEMERFQEEYLASQYRAMDQRVIYEGLTRLGVTPGMAGYAAQVGPTAVEWALRASLGDLKADRILDELADLRVKTMPMPAPPHMPAVR